MPTTAERTPTLPTSDTDPFAHEVLEDPLPMQAALRDAGPLVYLTRYDVYAMARYEQVHAALVDWQEVQSSAGGGLPTSRYEKPWRRAERAPRGRPAAPRRPSPGAQEDPLAPVAAPA